MNDKLTIRGLESFMPEEQYPWKNLNFDRNEYMYELIHIVDFNENSSLNLYTLKLISDASGMSADEEGGDAVYSYENKKSIKKIVSDAEAIPIKRDTSTVNDTDQKINFHLKSVLDTNKLIAYVNSYDKEISGLNKASMSAYMCNETYYITYDVIYKFGFIDIKKGNLLLMNDQEKAEVQ
ncbi:unnamed protein product [Didymodactylos carnosus]|uniref:Uncharacterized protein n=1 Tax=Didymodactylos carnosus TaxID=1234261 RepID=A0A814EHF2_9BILA|nr:unnamed protein product [Didymodactylos carnosus]CAF0966378.1 unnamed protein product [Didymodactylos carnosus]CAF3602038.1 unnamed protein product [Didymodactylos carnosus]CAF3739896.1 unnamed protein product [Didymodactylos carnosus]